MHRGRPYPRHPTYWATEAWFWPGFVPWKLRLDTTVLYTEPWNQIPLDFGGISFPGYHDSKPLVMAYDFLILAGSPPLTLRVFLDRVGAFPNWKARWRCEIGRNWLTVESTAYLIQPYPQLEVKADNFQYCVPVPPYTDTAGVTLHFRPATYAQGGSPYD